MLFNRRFVWFSRGLLLNAGILAFAQDPRSLPQCREVFGAWSNYSVRTVEDVLASRRSPDSRHWLMGNPYGVLIDNVTSYDEGRNIPLIYVEIPKAGSSTMKATLGSCKHRFQLVNKVFRMTSDIVSRGAIAFAIVREPLERFLSGYATIRHRIGDGKPFAETMSELQRFQTFVDLLTSMGEGVLKLPLPIGPSGQEIYRHVWFHTFSQMWFLEQFPHEVRHILHLETIEADIAALGRRVQLPVCKHFMSANAREGGSMVNRSMLRAEAPDAISKVVDYFRQDYACLGYEPPAGR